MRMMISWIRHQCQCITNTQTPGGDSRGGTKKFYSFPKPLALPTLALGRHHFVLRYIPNVSSNKSALLLLQEMRFQTN